MKTDAAPDLDGRFAAIPDKQVSCEVSGETVILDLVAGRYYSLAGVGSRLWQLLQQPVAAADMCATIMAEYEVSEEECSRDVRELLGSLIAKGLIEPHDE